MRPAMEPVVCAEADEAASRTTAAQARVMQPSRCGRASRNEGRLTREIRAVKRMANRVAVPRPGDCCKTGAGAPCLAALTPRVRLCRFCRPFPPAQTFLRKKKKFCGSDSGGRDPYGFQSTWDVEIDGSAGPSRGDHAGDHVDLFA